MGEERRRFVMLLWGRRVCKAVSLFLVMAISAACSRVPVAAPPQVGGNSIEAEVFELKENGVYLEAAYPLAKGAAILRDGKPFPSGQLQAMLPMYVTLRDREIVRMEQTGGSSPKKAPEAGETVFSGQLAAVGPVMGFLIKGKFAPNLQLHQNGKLVPISELKPKMRVRVTINGSTIEAIEDLGSSSK